MENFGEHGVTKLYTSNKETQNKTIISLPGSLTCTGFKISCKLPNIFIFKFSHL